MMNMTLLIASVVAMAIMLLLNWLAWRQVWRDKKVSYLKASKLLTSLGRTPER